MRKKTPGTIMYQLCKIWNETTNDIKCNGNYFSLKRELKSSALKSLKRCDIEQCQTCLIDKGISYD